jgi:glutamate/aspartate transport system substrate-binding protein
MRLVHRISMAAAFAWLAALPAAHAGSTLDRIAQREQLNLGYRSDAPPFSYHDAKGQPIGYSVELCRAIAQRIQAGINKPAMKVRTIAVAADQLGRVVASGGVDLMCAGTSDTPERRKTMDFSPPIFLSSVKFLVRDPAKYGAVAQLKGQTVAVIGRTTAQAAVEAYSTQSGLALKVSRVVSPEAAFSQLVLGQAAAYARDEILLLGQRAADPQAAGYALLPDAISTEVIAIAMPRGDAELQKLVQEALSEMARDGRLQAAYERWFVQPTPGKAKPLNLPMSAELKAAFDKMR